MASVEVRPVPGPRWRGFLERVKKLSISGVIFATLFALLAVSCLVWTLHGQWFAPAFVFIVTLPFSLALLALSVALQHALGLSGEVMNWALFALSTVLGVFEFYFLGWFMEKPFRR